MQTLRMGANAPLDTSHFEVVIEWPVAAGTLDCSTYLLGSAGKVQSDEDMIFYNQRSHATGAVAITRIEEGRTHLAVDLGAVPAHVVRIVICATIEEPGRTMAGFEGTSVMMRSNGESKLLFAPDVSGAREVAMRLVEIYRRNDAWKVRADGQGFNDGLAPLARSFGIDVADDEAAPPREDPAPLASPSSPLRAAPAPTNGTPPADDPDRRDNAEDSSAAADASRTPEGGVTRLGESLESYRWRAGAQEHLGALTAKLAWTSQCGGLGGRPRALDLTFGCLYELKDGRRGAVQPLDGKGNFDGPPYVQLLEAEAGGAGGTRKLRLNGEQWPQMKRLILYAYIADGAPSWASAVLGLEIAATNRPPLMLEMREGIDGCGLVALLKLENKDDDVVFTRIARFMISHQELDRDFGWGLSWKIRRH